MSKRLFIIQNIEREGPGKILESIQNRTIPHERLLASDYFNLPSPSEVAGVIILGGPDSANDPTPKIQRQLSFIQEIIRHSVPFLGICLGMQLLVKAAGGQVVPCPTKELGFRTASGTPFKVHLTSEAATVPLLKGIPTSFPIFHLHGETVVPLPGIKVIAEGNECPIQIVQVGQNAFGIQGHLELTEDMLHQWLNEDPDLQQLDRQEVLEDYRRFQTMLHQVGEQLIHNFTNLVQQNE